MIARLAIILLLALASGCAAPQRGGGWDGPIVDPDGFPIPAPTYEAAQ